MCGIYGTNFNYSREIIQKKLDAFAFRGPDYSGIKNYEVPDGHLTLGHNRLAIIDLDARANQPFDYSSNISLVLNGEIYNFLELKQTYFPTKTFKTTSDTEVLAAMYERFGMDCTSYLNGMFAFMIYDKQKQVLFGARDRVGKKPFYYYHKVGGKGGFEFASQLFPLCVGNDFELDTDARKLFFLLQYVPDPFSIFKEVKKLKAGYQCMYNLITNELTISSYWDIYDNSCGFTTPKSYGEALEKVDSILNDAVSKRLIADVPVGVFLSGGVDSSLISAYVSKCNKQITNFSVGFEEADFDETYYSRAVSEQLNVPYHHILCNYDAAIDIIDTLPYYYDEPFGDSSAIPTSLLSKVTKQYVTVALGGDGGDELFWGYNRYRFKSIIQLALLFPLWIRKMGALGFIPFGKQRYAELFKAQNDKDLYLKSIMLPYFEGAKFSYKDVLSLFTDTSYLYNAKEFYKAVSDFDIKTYMNYDCITKVDRASMQFALEVRNPLMDFRLVEYSRLLPLDYMYTKEMGQKRLLKDILYKDVSKDLFLRKKQGFAVPIGKWFQTKLKNRLIDVVNEDTLKELTDFDAKTIIRMRDQHIRGEKMYTVQLWYLFSYLNWWKVYKERMRY